MDGGGSMEGTRLEAAAQVLILSGFGLRALVDGFCVRQGTFRPTA
jgi:hypothetical protein